MGPAYQNLDSVNCILFALLSKGCGRFMQESPESLPQICDEDISRILWIREAKTGVNGWDIRDHFWNFVPWEKIRRYSFRETRIYIHSQYITGIGILSEIILRHLLLVEGRNSGKRIPNKG